MSLRFPSYLNVPSSLKINDSGEIRTYVLLDFEKWLDIQSVA
jgi:hypothetical protein